MIGSNVFTEGFGNDFDAFAIYPWWLHDGGERRFLRRWRENSTISTRMVERAKVKNRRGERRGGLSCTAGRTQGQKCSAAGGGDGGGEGGGGGGGDRGGCS